MIVAGTGHRLDKLGGYNDTRAFQNTVWLAQFCVERLKPSQIISGMAIGWDQALALAAIRCNVPFVAAVPFAGQERRWPTQARELYETILERAARVEVTSYGPSNEAFQIRNEWMVDRADLVLALFNGSRGGTRNCILYAQAKGVPVENVWPEWLALNELV